MMSPDTEPMARQNDQDTAKATETEKWLVFESLMREYSTLKAEQTARIGFRDNLLYINLSAVGAVFAFSVTKAAHHDTLLVIPWISVILGWTYLVNDQHISRIGKYVREDLTKRLRHHLDAVPEDVFRWEPFHRSDLERKRRKYLQLFIDQLTFVMSGVTALWLFISSNSAKLSTFEWIIVTIEVVALVGLEFEICRVADLSRSKLKRAESTTWREPE